MYNIDVHTCRVLDESVRSDIETQRLSLAKEKEDLEREQEAFEKRRQTLEEAQLRLEAERRDMEREHAAQVLPPFLNSSSLQNEVFADPPIGKRLAGSVGAAEEERRRAGGEGDRVGFTTRGVGEGENKVTCRGLYLCQKSFMVWFLLLDFFVHFVD